MDELNRDLLVAVLALLTDAIPRPNLSAALAAWSKDRKQPLAQRLLREGRVDADRLRALQCLAEAHLKGHQNDVRLCLDAWNAQHLTQEVLTEIGDVALRTTLGLSPGGNTTLAAGPGDPGVLASPGSAELPQFTEGERFLPLRPHARGGIGLVWVARDCELQREVALKVIQPRYAEREDQRARFVLEAEITGNLEHPGIVPVYSLGRNADGRPYYAMRFIRGESLSVAIRQFHQQFRADGGAVGDRTRSMWGIEFRQLLGRFLDVCDAMDYAHNRGVIHRDLKPANIMLGRYGETLVVDWGLAKVIGKADLLPAQVDGEVELSLARASTSSGETQQGIAIGTPSYMSPEQARGSIDQLGAASDVYSLGATLYELLTGQVAFPGEKVTEVLEQVVKGEFPPPRAVLRSVPAPLEAICLKAMAGRPELRYASVRALAQDIEHWLADEPVAAYPERRLERLGRWLRQHRTWTYAAVAALIGISLAATIGVVVVEQARRREAQLRAENETNFRMAQQAVEDYLTSVSENTLLQEQNSHDIRSLRRELLENALKYYQRFVKIRKDDPLLQQALANAYFRVGEITREIASPEEAIAAFSSARAIWEPLATADPGDRDLQFHLAVCHLAIGKLQIRLGNLQGALTTLTRARGLLEPLAEQHPAVAPYQASLASCYAELGLIQARLESPDQALDLFEKARTVQQRLIGRYPQEIGYQRSLAEIINQLGFAYYKKFDYRAALRSFQEVHDLCQTLLNRVTIGPKPVQYLSLLALSHYNIANIQSEQGHIDQALESYEESLKYRSALVENHTSVREYQENLGESYREIAYVQHAAHQDAKAFASLEKSLDVFRRLVGSQPENAAYHSELGRTWNTIGHLLDEARENVKAIPAFQNAVHEQQQAASGSKEVNEYKVYLCNHLENLGEQFVDLGQVAEAWPHYEEAIRIRTELHSTHQGNREYALQLAQALSTLGTIRRHAGDSVAARKSFTQAREILDAMAPTAPADAKLRGQLGAILTQEGCATADREPPGQALPLLQRATATLTGLTPSSGDEAQHREWLSEALWEQARILRALNRSADAEGIDVHRATLWKSRPPAELAQLALNQASRAALIGYGKTPISDSAKAVRKLDLAQAAANLKLAISRWFQDWATLRANPIPRSSGREPISGP